VRAAGREFVIAYDISDDRERARVDKVLKGYGFRAQKSVYECRLTVADEAALRRELERLALKSGSARIYRRLAQSEVAVIGVATDASPDDGFAFIV
jgi:CRISPR-associated protein Cas2